MASSSPPPNPSKVLPSESAIASRPQSSLVGIRPQKRYEESTQLVSSTSAMQDLPDNFSHRMWRSEHLASLDGLLRNRLYPRTVNITNNNVTNVNDGSRSPQGKDSHMSQEQASQTATTNDKPAPGTIKQHSNGQHGSRPPQRLSLRPSLPRLLWILILPVLWIILLVPMLRHWSGCSTPAHPIEDTKAGSVDEKFASSLTLLSSIKTSIESGSIPSASKLHEQCSQATINRRDTIISHRNLSNHLYNLFAMIRNAQTAQASTLNDSYSDKTFGILLRFIWPWENTGWHKKRTALALAMHLDHNLQHLNALGTSYVGNLTQWMDSMTQMSETIYREHNAAVQSKIDSLSPYKNTLGYVRDLRQGAGPSKAAEALSAMDELVCQTVKFLLPLLETAQRVQAGSIAIEKEVWGLRKRCQSQNEGCRELMQLLEGKIFKHLGAWLM
ncbi:MAG: hypothetical protein Q9166_005549 [cf. Caloplaca sp. 2 TL-2023]